MSRSQRLKFDPNGPFVARRTTTFNGDTFYLGDPFPMDGVPARRLRQLFDDRRIDMDVGRVSEVVKPVVAPVVEAAVDSIVPSQNDPVQAICDLPDDELFARAMLATGVRYRVRERAIKALEGL